MKRRRKKPAPIAAAPPQREPIWLGAGEPGVPDGRPLVAALAAIQTRRDRERATSQTA